jgi:hypothetical protein
MTDARTTTQFSVFLVNKPGVLAQVTRALAEQRINVIAMTLVDSQEHGVLRTVAEDATAARQVLQRLNLPMTETDVIVLELSNRPGALADVATLLGTNHININYAYVTSGAPGGKTTGVFKVADLTKALHVLNGRGARPRPREAATSRSRRAGRTPGRRV